MIGLSRRFPQHTLKTGQNPPEPAALFAQFWTGGDCSAGGRGDLNILHSSHIPFMLKAISASQKRTRNESTSVNRQPYASCSPDASPVITASSCMMTSAAVVTPRLQPMRLPCECTRKDAQSNRPPPRRTSGNNSAGMR